MFEIKISFSECEKKKKKEEEKYVIASRESHHIGVHKIVMNFKSKQAFPLAMRTFTM